MMCGDTEGSDLSDEAFCLDKDKSTGHIIPVFTHPPAPSADNLEAAYAGSKERVMKCNKCGYESDVDFAHACPKSMAYITQGEVTKLQMQIFNLTAENAKLRSALEKIAGIRGRDLSEPWSDAEIAEIAVRETK